MGADNFKEKLQRGEPLHGCWINGGSALDAEIVGKAGFDWVTIDLEHGVGTEFNLVNQLMALKGSSACPLVRVEALVRQRVSRTLDLGATGIIFPMIRNLEEAEMAVSFMRYPPDGVRGMALMTRATDYGHEFETYFQTSRDQLVTILQVENKECLQQVQEIAQLDGVDVLFVGPADLTLSMGIFREYDHPAFIEALKAVQTAAEKNGICTGVLMSDPDEYEKYYNLGFRMLGCGSDSVFLQKGAQNMVLDLKDQQNRLD